VCLCLHAARAGCPSRSQGHASDGHDAPENSLACGATASAPTGQIVQPWAESAAHCWLAQCLHRYSSPRRSTRYAARTAGPHRSHASFNSASPFLAESRRSRPYAQPGRRPATRVGSCRIRCVRSAGGYRMVNPPLMKTVWPLTYQPSVSREPDPRRDVFDPGELAVGGLRFAVAAFAGDGGVPEERSVHPSGPVVQRARQAARPGPVRRSRPRPGPGRGGAGAAGAWHRAW
jgi:hypothetical protein